MTGRPCPVVSFSMTASTVPDLTSRKPTMALFMSAVITSMRGSARVNHPLVFARRDPVAIQGRVVSRGTRRTIGPPTTRKSLTDRPLVTGMLCVVTGKDGVSIDVVVFAPGR